MVVICKTTHIPPHFAALPVRDSQDQAAISETYGIQEAVEAFRLLEALTP
jgi:hypothetical protein